MDAELRTWPDGLTTGHVDARVERLKTRAAETATSLANTVPLQEAMHAAHADTFADLPIEDQQRYRPDLLWREWWPRR